VILAPGVGLAWRPETAWLCDQRPALTEVLADGLDPRRLPRPLAILAERGVPIVPHGVGLSLGGAAPVDRDRLARLATLARALRAPLVSEHVAFVRGGGREAGHLLPVPRTRPAMAALVDNVRRAQDALPVPLALENIAAAFRWPGDAGADADFVAELLDRTGAYLLLDLANLHANALNHGFDAAAAVDRYPLHRLAYVHVAGGAWSGRWWRDTHAHPTAASTLDLLRRLVARLGPVPVVLERDRAFGTRADLDAELDAIADAAAPAAAPAKAPPRPPRPALAAGAGDLASAQAAVVAALVAGAEPPAGFDAAELAFARDLLAARSMH